MSRNAAVSGRAARECRGRIGMRFVSGLISSRREPCERLIVRRAPPSCRGLKGAVASVADGHLVQGRTLAAPEMGCNDPTPRDIAAPSWSGFLLPQGHLHGVTHLRGGLSSLGSFALAQGS